MMSLLEFVERLAEPQRLKVYEALPPGLQETVRAVMPVAWLPLTLNVQLCDAIAGSLGPTRAQAFFREMLLSEYQSSLFKPFIAGITRVLGVTPAVFVKMVPRGWELVYRECGTWQVLDDGDRRARLVVSDLPAMCVRNAFWLDAVRSTFYTAFDLSNVQGEIDWHELDLGSRRATMCFSWQA